MRDASLGICCREIWWFLEALAPRYFETLDDATGPSLSKLQTPYILNPNSTAGPAGS